MESSERTIRRARDNIENHIEIIDRVSEGYDTDTDEYRALRFARLLLRCEFLRLKYWRDRYV